MPLQMFLLQQMFQSYNPSSKWLTIMETFVKSLTELNAPQNKLLRKDEP